MDDLQHALNTLAETVEADEWLPGLQGFALGRVQAGVAELRARVAELEAKAEEAYSEGFIAGEEAADFRNMS